MKESPRKDRASHPDPESCVGVGNATDEALTGAHADSSVLACDWGDGSRRYSHQSGA